MEAEGDIFFKGQPQQVYDGLRSRKTLIKFGAEDGAENHCQSGALSHKEEVAFDWIDETLKLSGNSKQSRSPLLRNSDRVTFATVGASYLWYWKRACVWYREYEAEGREPVSCSSYGVPKRCEFEPIRERGFTGGGAEQ
jgi:hypothetical protein